MKYIYLYTTQSYRAKNWYKIGQSITNPETRIQQQDNASNPEPLIFINAWAVNDSVTDKRIHKQLEKDGFKRLRSGREWFELSDMPHYDIMEAINAFSEIIEDFDLQKPIKKQQHEICNAPNYTEMWWYKN